MSKTVHFIMKLERDDVDENYYFHTTLRGDALALRSVKKVASFETLAEAKAALLILQAAGNTIGYIWEDEEDEYETWPNWAGSGGTNGD